MAFWSEFLEACGNTENVSIICRDGVIRSHKLVLAHISKLMEDILKDIPTGDEATIYLSDTIKTDIEYLLQNAAPDKTKCSKEAGLLFGMDVPRVDSITEVVEEKCTLIHFKTEIAEEDEPEDEDQAGPYFDGNSYDLKPTEPKKNRKQRAKCLSEAVKDEDYLGDENKESIDEHPNDFKKSKSMYKEEKAWMKEDLFLNKKERTKNALAALKSGQISSIRKAAKIFGLSHVTLSSCLRQNRVIRRTGAKMKYKYLSQEEENHIAQRVRSLAKDNTVPDFKSVKKIFFEEIETLKINFPERVETLDELKYLHVRRFIDRYNLCKESEEERKKYLDENRTFECEVCHKLFTNKKYILKHMRTIHSFLFT